MNRTTLLPAFFGLATLALATTSNATSFAPRDDFAVVSLDARSGEHQWTHYPEKLSRATSELYSGYLLVNGHIDTLSSSTTFVVGLDPATGKVIDEPASLGNPLAVSDTRAQPTIQLDNGWKLSFDPGNSETLDFLDAQGTKVWTIQPNGYPEIVTSWHDTVFYEMSYPQETIVYAYEAGAMQPKWTFDPRTLVTVTDEPVHRLHFRISGDDFYVGLHQHLFLLDPATGMVKKQWDLGQLTGVPFISAEVAGEAFFHGGIEMASISINPETIVLGFEGQIVALDRPSGDFLWHAASHTVPYSPFPLLHEQQLVLMAHENLAGPRPPPPPLTPIQPSGCSFMTPANQSGGYWQFVLGLGVVVLARRGRGMTRHKARS
jgi:outer membrane protein assembly factor BamB